MTVFSFLICAGCGQQVQPPVNQVASSTNEKVQGAVIPPANKQQLSLLHTDDKGRKWIGDVPFDVFDVYFDEPLQVASNNQTSNLMAANSNGNNSMGAGTNTMQVAESPSPAENKPATETKSATVESAGWKQVISNEVLMSEVKRIRNEVSTKLKSVGEFNNSFAEIEILGGTLAAMAIIAFHHDEPPNWKEKALAVRDLAGELSAGANAGRGRENFEKCQAPFEKIMVILDGSSPPDLKIPDNKDDWYATADTKLLMKRMEASQAWLRLNVQNDKDFKGKINEITSENSVMAALTQIIRHHDYAYADEELYQNFTKDLLSANQSIVKSINDGNFELYQSATAAIEKACSACHLKYRFE